VPALLTPLPQLFLLLVGCSFSALLANASRADQFRERVLEDGELCRLSKTEPFAGKSRKQVRSHCFVGRGADADR
jgi:hypothetical protein